jgi:hypothetical protein
MFLIENMAFLLKILRGYLKKCAIFYNVKQGV